MVPSDATNLTSDAISGHGSKKYQNGHLCVSGLKLLATTVHYSGMFFSAGVFPARAWHVIVVPEAVFRIAGHQAAWVRAANRAKVFTVTWAAPPLRYPITAPRFYFMI